MREYTIVTTINHAYSISESFTVWVLTREQGDPYPDAYPFDSIMQAVYAIDAGNLGWEDSCAWLELCQAAEEDGGEVFADQDIRREFINDLEWTATPA